MVNIESNIFYVVNAKVSIFNIVISNQVNAKAINTQTNLSYTANTEANATYENIVYNEFEAFSENMTIRKVNIDISIAIM
ncbi:34562_t:CDS:2 [Racocetra persica]|uniref:34562_t:CDS:1 n=1 Tax=Racocetra persica TaxID=160502 RepID=A0ACA9MI89_9GLOM|nr:34562_t:CDS:2 [Racocetra persica]